MAQSSLFHGERAPLARAAALFLLLAAPACAPEDVLEARSFDCAEGAHCATPFALDADDPRTFCDDQNPCAATANCTPCSTLPEAQRDIRHCTPDDELPPSARAAPAASTCRAPRPRGR
jgi:hypothetical protein